MRSTLARLIEYRVDAGVAVLQLNDPPANTYSYAMNRQLDERNSSGAHGRGVHVIVLTGAGEKFFCAGANIQMLTDGRSHIQVLLLPAR